MWGSLLVHYFIILLYQSQWLYLVLLVYSFKITIYLLVDTDCNIQLKIIIADSFNKQCNTYIYGIIHKQMRCDIFRSICSQHTCIWHKHINQWHTKTTINLETHMVKTTKALFIWHERYFNTFCLHTQLANSSLGILYNSYRLISSHGLGFWDYVLLLSFTHVSIRTQLGSILYLNNSPLLFSIYIVA